MPMTFKQFTKTAEMRVLLDGRDDEIMKESELSQGDVVRIYHTEDDPVNDYYMAFNTENGKWWFRSDSDFEGDFIECEKALYELWKANS
jgi:hypothetical protein